MKCKTLFLLLALWPLSFTSHATGIGHATPDIRVVLLGTGGPELTPGRLGHATLIEAGDQTLLFDAGRGVVQRLYESGVNPAQVTRVFLTHLHNDHIEGLPTLWITPWFLLGRDTPLQLWGPEGTRQMVDGMRAMFRFDIEHRSNAFNRRENLEVPVTEIKPGVVYERDGLTVGAFVVEHDDGNPAFGYSVDYRGHRVVLSGDTTYSENVVQAARGADVLVHNVVALGPALAKAPEMQGVQRKLTTPEQAASVFMRAKPSLAVFSHVVKKALPGRQGDEAILRRVRAAGYAGRLAMGYDRTVIDVGTTVRVHAPASTASLPDLDRKPRYAGASK